MGWKTVCHFGQSNLTGNTERLEAIQAARSILTVNGFPREWIKETLQHEKDHLFAFPDFDSKSGKKLRLVLERHASDGYRLALVINRRQLRKDVEASLKAVDDPSEGDLKFGCFNRYR